jgi:DNA-binding GntR family transcriptional regulator
MDRARPRSGSLTKSATDTLRQMIVEGVLNLGETLSESKVARLLGVSRTPIREAFARLEIEGLVFSEPQRSTRVFLLGPRDVDDICDVRCCLEKMALALAMKGDRQTLLSRLSEATRRMTEAIERQDVSEYLRVDSAFHQAVFECTGNVFLNDAYQTIAPKLAALRTRLATRPDYLRKGFVEHQRLCALVQFGDVDGALSVLEEHVSRKEDSFWHLDDGLAGTEPGAGKTEHRTGTAATNTRSGRQDRTPRPAVATADPDNIFIDENISRRSLETVSMAAHSDNLVDDNGPTDNNAVDVKRRGRPRLHADGAARKRAWAARQRAKAKDDRSASDNVKKRGRPRKYASQAERQQAYEKRRRKPRTLV